MRNILCKIGLHRWKIIKSARASHILLLLKSKHKILKRSKYELEKDYLIENRKCLRCEKIYNEIDETIKILKEKLSENLRVKKTNE